MLVDRSHHKSMFEAVWETVSDVSREVNKGHGDIKEESWIPLVSVGSELMLPDLSKIQMTSSRKRKHSNRADNMHHKSSNNTEFDDVIQETYYEMQRNIEEIGY